MFNSNSDQQGNSVQQSSGNGKEWDVLEKVAMASTVEQRKSRRWGIFFKSLTFIYLFFALALLMPNRPGMSNPAEAGKHVALVSLEGVIAADTEANANVIVSGLRSAFEAENSVGVILAINSPGGSPVQSGYVNDEITRLREKYPEKTIHAVIADIGASGGYYVAAAAENIYADKASLVGSIGVISAGFGFVDLMEKVGVDRRVYSAGESKNFLDPFSASSEGDVEFWQSVLSTTHQQFIDVVKAGRGDRILDRADIFSGKVWSGEQAVALGLIDGLGSAGYVAREVFGVEEIVEYTVQPNPFENFARRFGASFVHGIEASTGLSLR